MGSADILKGVGLRRANALAVNLDVGDSIALIRSDGEGLISALTDADIAGGRNGAASPGSCLDGVVAVAAASTAIVAPLSRDGQVFGGHGGGDGRGPPCEGVAGLGGIGGIVSPSGEIMPTANRSGGEAQSSMVNPPSFSGTSTSTF